jgi:hypothetical protein
MLKHKRLIVFSLIIILAVFVVAWLAPNDKKSAASRTVESAPSEADRSLSSSKSGLLKSVVPVRTKRTLQAQPPFEVLAKAPDKIIAEAKDAANNGIPAAQRALAQALYKCATAPMGDDDEVEAAIVKRSLVFEAGRKNAGIPLEKDAGYFAGIQGQIADAKETRDSCRNVPVAESKTWLSWMEKAAIAGDEQARFAYAWTALDEFKTREDQLANNDEYIRRRDTASGLLQDSIANGDCDDMLLNGFRKVSPDPVTGYVYEGILLRRGLAVLSTSPPSQDIELQRASINKRIKELAADVPDDQLAAANNSIAYIQQNYCNQ